MSLSIAIFPTSNSISITPQTPSYYRLGQAAYTDTVQDWQAPLPYVQKVLNTDEITVQVHFAMTGFGASYIIHQSTCRAYLCDRDKKIISGIDLNSAPYYKGMQLLTNNTYTDPYTQVSTDLATAMFVFRFSYFPGYIPDGGIYYFRLDTLSTQPGFPSDIVVGMRTFYSEPLYVSTAHPNTVHIQGTFRGNDCEKNMLVTGWYSDFPANTTPYYPTFATRVEGYVSPPTFKVVNIGYLQQQYEQQQIKTKQVRTWSLKVGAISLGIPHYMLELVTELLLSDDVQIDNYPYIIFNPKGSDGMADLWKVKSTDPAPLVHAECQLMETYSAMRALIAPPPAPYLHVFNSTFDATFA